MKTATVRDLRNRFPRVAARIDEGEPVEITKSGKPFAHLVPVVRENPRKLVKPDIMARLKEVLGRRVYSTKEIEAMRAAEIGRRGRVIAFPDTSFLCALYCPTGQFTGGGGALQGHAGSVAHFQPDALRISPERAFSQVWLDARDKSKGYPQNIADAALDALQSDLENGVVLPISADWPDVHRQAETLSKRHTISGGHRAFKDPLHVATALHLEAREFLTFDANQRKLAVAEKLKVKP